MALRPASELCFSPPPRCPRCNAGILPYGRSEPFAVDGENRPYCRVHGHEIEPDYPRVHAEYTEQTRARHQAAFRALEEEPPASHP